METPVRQRIIPETPKDKPHALRLSAPDTQFAPAPIGLGHEHHAMQNSVGSHLVEEALRRTVVPSLTRLERAVTDNEKLLRSFIETLQLWFSEFQTPRKRLQEDGEEQAKASLAKQKDADMCKDMQAALTQPFETDQVERVIQDQLGSLEQKLNVQFQKVILQLNLSRQSWHHESRGGGDALLAKGPAAADAMKCTPNIATYPLATSDKRNVSIATSTLSSDQSSGSDELSDVGDAPPAKSKAAKNALKHAATVESAACGLEISTTLETSGLGLRSQQFRLARHIARLTRATKSRDVAAQVQQWLVSHDLIGGTTLAKHCHSRISNWTATPSLGSNFFSTNGTSTTSHKHDRGVCWERWRIESFTDDPAFNMLTTVMIVSNAIWITWSTDYAMKQAMRQAYRLRFFTQPSWRYNVFDIFVVVMGCLDQFTNGVAMNSNVLRAVRLLRVLRMLKFVKSLTFFTELQQLLCATMNCAKTLMWTLILVGFCTGLAAITAMEVILSLGNTIEQEHRNAIERHFGSFGQSIGTLFLCVSNGDLWGTVSRELKKVTPFMQYIIGLHVMFMFFLIVPVLHGTHTMRVLNTQKYEPYVNMTRKLQDANTFIEGLRHRCANQGYYLNNLIDMKTMEEIMEELETNTFLLANDIEVRAQDAFQIFDTENEGMITVRQFIFGCHFLTCTSTDSFLLSQQIAMISQDMAAMKDRVKTLSRSVHASVGA